jgi:hypothetical protein
MGYSIEGGGKYFTVIPPSLNFQNVLVSFASKESRPEDKIFVEKDPVEFYTKYSGGVVILYNYARLKTILDKYEGLVETEGYPPIPSIDEVQDFSSLGQAKVKPLEGS